MFEIKQISYKVFFHFSGGNRIQKFVKCRGVFEIYFFQNLVTVRFKN